jgi:quinohemoprotein ethanol dehydrogenase
MQPWQIPMCALLLATALATQAATRVDTRAIADEQRSDGWLSYGRSYSEQRFSPLAEINADTAATLGLAWYLDLPGVNSLEATPLMVDGMLYFSAHNSVVFAVDARNGTLRWRYDPEVWRHAGKRLRQLFPANRGVAFWKGRVYVGTYDGRLIALDARSGKQVWSTQTLADGATGYISGAPRAFDGMVIIGQGGTEAGASRGYVTAYDAATGKQRWRFYTVPGNPAKGFENAAMAAAANTWSGEWWKHGGGGTPWNAITYDPEFDRVYIGTGNGAPWNHKVRSPEGGDNLFVCSIVALDAKSGEYVWHYQTNPGETWDYTSTQDIVLADLAIGTTMRKVIMHAPKNGFFYVIDRADGKLISAEKLGKVTWAERIDLGTGRPVENPEARFPTGAGLVYPSGAGLHNWQAMSFSPRTGLVYVPTVEMPQYYSDKSIDRANWQARPFAFNTGYDVIDVEGLGEVKISGSLLAWDPVAQRKVWEAPLPGFWNGGTLTTAGELVFQGNAGGEFAAYHARSGAKVWSSNVGHGIVAAPITYQLDDTQYVAILSGWGGTLAGMFGLGTAPYGWLYGQQPRRLLVYALNGKAQLPISPKADAPTVLDDRALVIDEALAAAGKQLFNSGCQSCHGFMAVAGGVAPDVRASALALDYQAFHTLLVQGGLEARGMPKYDDLTDAEIRGLFMYIRQRARADLLR